VAVEFGLHRRRRLVIGKLQLDCAKAGRGRRREPLDQRPLGEQIGQIGGEAGHAQIRPLSLPGLTRQSIHLLKLYAKKMDARVKPGHDEPTTTSF
jgi:hypothetical protein